MARLLLNFPERQAVNKTVRTSNMLQQNSSTMKKQSLSPIQIERVLNKKRSKEYIEAMTKLDAGEHMHDSNSVSSLIDCISKELPEIEIDMGPIGIVSKCYLGSPYEVHTLDVAGRIIEHYEFFRTMPKGLEKARKLALSGHYAFIEVYHHAIRAIKEDGTVATLKE